MAASDIEDIIDLYKRRQQNLITKTLAQIMLLFDRNASKLATMAARRSLVNNRFLPKDIRATIDRISRTIETDTKKIIINGIRKSWELSNLKNDEIVKALPGGSGRKPPRAPRSTTSSSLPNDPSRHNYSAREAFIKRKDTGGRNQGLNLSKRVHKLSNVYKKAINETLVEGIKEGKPAREIAKNLRTNLRNNKKVENPGTGVYKSPQKNAERLSRNEINLAYANADYDRWQQMWFVVGIEIRLSNRHPKYDICDSMKGVYPKNFHFTLWHPNCLCIALPVLAPRDVRDQMLDYELGLTDKPPAVKYVDKMPKEATAWIKKNADRIKGWSNTPYWVESNPDFVTALIK